MDFKEEPAENIEKQKQVKVKTPDELRTKLNELQKKLVMSPPGRIGGVRVSIRDKIKILYWALGELEDKDLN